MIWTVLTLFSIVGLGYFAKSINLIKEKDAELLKKIVLKFTLPATVALAFINTTLEAEHAKIAILGIVSTFVGIGFYLLFFKYIYKKKDVFPSAVPLAFFSNSGFLGLPVMASLFGEKGLSLALPFQVFSHGPIMLFTIGAFVLAYYGKSKKKKSTPQLLKEVFLTPIILAVPIGIILHFIWLPEFIINSLNIVATANTFLIMITVGLMLNPKNISTKYVWPTVIIVLCTLLLTPTLTYLTASVMNMEALSLQIAVLEAGMPTAVLCLLLIKEYKMNAELGETVFFVSTVLSVISLPAINFIFF